MHDTHDPFSFLLNEIQAHDAGDRTTWDGELRAHYLDVLLVEEAQEIAWGRRHLTVIHGETLDEIADRSPTFIGMKHAVNDLGFVSECLQAQPDMRIFVGLEELSFPGLAIGACGVMNAVGNLRPRALADMCEAVWRNDLAAARALHDRLFEINRAVFFDTNPIPMKYMMKKLGLLENNEHRLPMMSATPELAAKLDGVLERAGL